MSSAAKGITEVVGDTKPQTSQGPRYCARFVDEYGIKLHETGFPDVRPQIDKGFVLIAVILGVQGSYGIEVSPRVYQEVVRQKKAPDSEITNVELYLVLPNLLEQCLPRG